MAKIITSFIIALMLLSCQSKEEQPTGPWLVKQSIAYHDPDSAWKNFSGLLHINLKYPDGKTRMSEVLIDNKQDQFSLYEVRQDTIYRYADKDTVYSLVNGLSISQEDSLMTKLRLTPEHTLLMRNYYTYLYGLPMKLMDSGTKIGKQIDTVNFYGEDLYKVKVTYAEDVGSDIWYFYFKRDNYALKAYQFFHDEGKNDGEYILLDGELQCNDIVFPKDRTWYTNDSSKTLGTDLLVSCDHPLK